jgi:hypothetical protein
MVSNCPSFQTPHYIQSPLLAKVPPERGVAGQQDCQLDEASDSKEQDRDCLQQGSRRARRGRVISITALLWEGTNQSRQARRDANARYGAKSARVKEWEPGLRYQKLRNTVQACRQQPSSTQAVSGSECLPVSCRSVLVA